MIGVVGLGNPGERYCDTRHNVGFWVVDKFAGNCSWQSKFGCLYVSVNQKVIGQDNSRVLVVKPQGFMNRSGEAAVPLLRYFRVEPKDIVIIHDDLDLEPGCVKVKFGGGSGGHRGLQNVIECLGTDQFSRVRLGIGHPSRGAKLDNSQEQHGVSQGVRAPIQRCDEQCSVSVSDWVLSRPRPNEKELLDDAVPKAVQAVTVIIEQGLAVAQRQCNR